MFKRPAFPFLLLQSFGGKRGAWRPSCRLHLVVMMKVGAPEAVTPFCARFHWADKLIGAALPFSVLRSGFALAAVAAGLSESLCTVRGGASFR